MGLGVDEDLSPAVMRKCVHLAAKLPSFQSAQESITETLEVELTIKRVERLTERIGHTRVHERDTDTLRWEALPLVRKLAAPPGVKPPEVARVSYDGGRMRRCDLPEDAKSHWCETKVGILLELEPSEPDLPAGVVKSFSASVGLSGSCVLRAVSFWCILGCPCTGEPVA